MERLSASAAFDNPLRGIVSRQLKQLKPIGLMLCDMPHVARQRGRLEHHCNIVEQALELCGTASFDELFQGHPVIYNPSKWTSDRLGGYIGQDGLEVPTDCVVRSYGEMWLIAARQPEAAALHFSKCVVWMFELSRRNLEVALRYFLDLHRAGYIAHPQVFDESLTYFARYYVSGTALPELGQKSRADVDSINSLLSAAMRAVPEELNDTARELEFASVLLELTTDDVAKARRAASLDDWFVHNLQLRQPTSSLAFAYHVWSKRKAPPAVLAMLSQIEEIQADLGAKLGSQRMLADAIFPVEWRASVCVYPEYKRVHKTKGAALDAIAAERFLFPEAVRDILRTKQLLKFLEDGVPIEGWERYSKEMAVPLSFGYGVETHAFRSGQIPKSQIESMKSLAAVRGDLDMTDQKARHAIRDGELAVIHQEIPAMRGNETDRERLAKMGAAYPWNALVVRTEGIVEGLQGRVVMALERFIDAVLLEPRDPMNWGALARLVTNNGDTATAKKLYGMTEITMAFATRTK